MNRKILAALGLSAALMMAGCAGQSAGNAQQDAAQSNQEQDAAKAQDDQNQDAAQEQGAAAEQDAAAGIVKYEDPEGWSASYDSSVIEQYQDDGVYFRYTGEADGVNQINVTYYPDQMPDGVLYEVMAGADGLPEHTRSEGYFAGRTDVWSMRTSMESSSVPGATDEFIAVERNGGTLLIQVTTSKQADEAAGIAVSDALSAVVDSFELADQQPQTYSAYVPGKYMEVPAEGEEQEESAEYYVQLNEDHTGVISMQDEVQIIWYSREGKILNAGTGEQLFEYNVEGDNLYLTDINYDDPDARVVFEFVKESVEAGEGSTAASGAETASSAEPAAAQEEKADAEGVDYSVEENWVYYGEGEDKDVDLFFVCPTVDTLDEENMSLDNEVMKGYFKGAINMERGIYEDSARMYAPYYRQMAMGGYELEDMAERERRLALAYGDVSDAFRYYLENENDGRPIILAGFSQGADMCYRLMEEYFGDEELQDRLLAVYAIGWACTDEMVEKYPQIVPAKSADDIGTVVTFDCEDPEITETVVNPAGQKGYCINPLNWKTDSTPADKSLNAGACFTGSKGQIKNEVPQLCGCYIDEERGVLKVTDVTAQEYPAKLEIFPDGAYHIYDYQFFFRNLQENVQHRVELYMEQAAAADQAA